MEIGIIAPIKFLERYCITTTQYCLPELLLNSKDYLNYYKRCFNKGHRVILDCRETETLRKPIKYSILKEVLEIFEPSHIIMPSYAFSLIKTLKVQEELLELDFLTPWKKNNRLIPCIEGTNEIEVLKYLETYPDIEIAIPSHMYIVTKRMLKPPRGFFIDNRNDPYEVKPGTGTLLTSMPVRLGFEGRLNSLGPTTSSTLNFYLEEDRFSSVVDKNISDLINYYREEK